VGVPVSGGRPVRVGHRRVRVESAGQLASTRRVPDDSRPGQGGVPDAELITQIRPLLSDRTGDYVIHNPLLVDTDVYASWYSDGVRVIGTSDPTAPREVAYFVPPSANNPVSPSQRGVLNNATTSATGVSSHRRQMSQDIGDTGWEIPGWGPVVGMRRDPGWCRTRPVADRPEPRAIAVPYRALTDVLPDPAPTPLTVGCGRILRLSAV
jgi:hypothetical protein